MGWGCQIFGREKWKMLNSQAFEGNFYHLSLNGENTAHFPFWPQIPCLTLKLSQKTKKLTTFWKNFKTFPQFWTSTSSYFWPKCQIWLCRFMCFLIEVWSGKISFGNLISFKSYRVKTSGGRVGSPPLPSLDQEGLIYSLLWVRLTSKTFLWKFPLLHIYEFLVPHPNFQKNFLLLAHPFLFLARSFPLESSLYWVGKYLIFENQQWHVHKEKPFYCDPPRALLVKGGSCFS